MKNSKGNHFTHLPKDNHGDLQFTDIQENETEESYNHLHSEGLKRI